MRRNRPRGRSLGIAGRKIQVETVGQNADEAAHPQLLGLERAQVQLER